MSFGLPTVECYQNFKEQPDDLHAFLSNVFQQVKPDRFMAIYSEAVENTSAEKIYQMLLQRAEEAKGNIFAQFYQGLNALNNERNTLAENVARIMDPNRTRNGYCETTMPGRMCYVLTKTMGIQGEITVINENESIIQSGFPKPYHTFIPLTYDPIEMEASSVDVLSCFAGLHHCPTEKLDQFIDSIWKSLTFGGVFLLREHDTHDDHMIQLAQIVHSVFNACTGVPLADEKMEVRNFKSVAEWIRLLELHGFKYVSDKGLIREGDSTKNTLIKFIKIGHENHEVDHLNTIREMLISKKPNYTRPLVQTHGTTPEWFNVESTKNLGSVDFYDYPFFQDVLELWKCDIKSWCAARKVEDFSGVLFSEHTFMSSMITAMMTTEYATKGIAFFPLWLAAQAAKILPSSSDDNDWSHTSEYYQNWYKEYGDRLNITPYYAQSYMPSIAEYWRNLASAWRSTKAEQGLISTFFSRSSVKNLVTGLALSADLAAKAAVAKPINWFYGGEEQGDDREIGIIVKTDTDLGENSIRDEGNPYQGLIIGRYKILEDTLRGLVNQGVEIIEIAGQNEIQIDLLVDADDQRYQQSKLYDRKCLENPDKKIVAMMVNVSDLNKYLKEEDIYRICDY